MDLDAGSHPFNRPGDILSALDIFKKTYRNGCTLQNIIDDYIDKFQTFPTFPITVKKGTTLFRARKNDGEKEECFSGLKDIGIKPSEYVTSFGRANIPKEPVFYCSTNEETVVREVTQWYINDNGRAQDLFTKKVFGMNWSPFTSMMTISAWVVKEDLNIALLFGNEDKRSRAIQQCAKDRYNLQNSEIINYNKSKNIILDFFSKDFSRLDVKHESEYIYSALYAFNVLNNQPNIENGFIKFDGVKYSSIANDFKGENYAISEMAFKNKIEFLGANYCYTCNNNNGKKVLENNSTALIGRVKSALLNNDGTFIWGDSEDGFDYVVRLNGQYHLMTFNNNVPNRFSKAVKTVFI